MKIKCLLLSVPLVLFLTGCQTTFYKPGASEADYLRDLTMAEMHADSTINDAMSMPAQSGLEEAMRGMAKPMMRRRLINDYMETLGWEKQTKGK